MTVGKAYAALIQRFPLVPIKNKKHLRTANVLAVELALKGEARTKEETDYLCVLSDLIHSYESYAFHHLRVKMSHGEILMGMLESSRFTQTQLAKIMRTSQARISDVINGRRELSKDQIMQLCLHFKLSSDLFFGDLQPHGSNRRAAYA